MMILLAFALQAAAADPSPPETAITVIGKKVCRTEHVTGSIMPKRLCRTEEEWADMTRNSQELMRKLRARQNSDRWVQESRNQR